MTPLPPLPEEFAAHIVPLRALLYAHAYKLTRNAADAEDLVQETLLRALTRFAQVRDTGALGGWLMTMQRRVFINAYVKRKRAPAVAALDDSLAETVLPTPGATPEQLALRGAENAALREAIASLPPVYRHVLAACDLGEASYEETARQVGAGIGTVRSRISRARAMVRATMAAWRGDDAP